MDVEVSNEGVVRVLLLQVFEGILEVLLVEIGWCILGWAGSVFIDWNLVLKKVLGASVKLSQKLK